METPRYGLHFPHQRRPWPVTVPALGDDQPGRFSRPGRGPRSRPDSWSGPRLAAEQGYDNKAPWPADADGGGASLQRRSALAFGNDPAAWRAADPTPGRFGEAEDSDGDGLPDAWELANGTNWQVADAAADPDHDGFTNLQEFLAGTDPRDPASRLTLRAAQGGGVISLQFLAASNHTYSLLYQDTLISPVWSKLADIPAQATNGSCSIIDSNAVGSARFYRLATPALP